MRLSVIPKAPFVDLVLAAKRQQQLAAGVSPQRVCRECRTSREAAAETM